VLSSSMALFQRSRGGRSIGFASVNGSDADAVNAFTGAVPSLHMTQLPIVGAGAAGGGWCDILVTAAWCQAV
jgi:hypothetical protein